MNNSQKIQDVFIRIADICNLLERDVRQSEIDLIASSIVTETFLSDLNELDQLYMYSQLLKDILLDLELDIKALREFVEFCRIHH